MRAADEVDFAAFVDAASGRLLRTAYLITGDMTAAQQFLQTALERAYIRWGYLRRTEGPEGYVRKSLVTAAITGSRRRGWRRRMAVGDAALLDASMAALPDQDALIARLRELPAAQRAVLVLRYFDGLTEAETASVLRLSLGTVRAQNARALQGLHLQPESKPA